MNFLFDLYGTLADIKTDENTVYLWREFAKLLGDDDSVLVKREYHALCKKFADERIHNFDEFDLLRVFEKMLEKRSIDPKLAPKFAREFRVLSRNKLFLFPCVNEILTGLKKRGAGVYLVSNAQSCFTRCELDELGITELFDGILISSEAGVKKPDIAIFEKAYEQFSIDKRNNVYVGNDMHDDVLGASVAGLKTVYIETEQSGKYPELDYIKPDYCAETHQQLRDILFAIAEGNSDGKY